MKLAILTTAGGLFVGIVAALVTLVAIILITDAVISKCKDKE
jgi:hypothetical protein